MNIMIIGAGFTGVQLARRLINEGNTVTIIDNNEDTVEQEGNRLNCNVFCGDGNNLAVLEKAKLRETDALVAVTGSDEINMITCSLVDAVYPGILKIARVRNYAYYVNTNDTSKLHAESFRGNHRPLYGIDYMIHPDVVAAEAIVKAVKHGAISDIVDFGENSDFEIASFQIEKGCKFDGIALKDTRSLSQKKFIVVYQETENREEQTETVLPKGDTILHAGDRIGLLTSKDDIPEMLELCGSKIDKIGKIALVGIGRIGTIVAEKIIDEDNSSLFKRLFTRNKVTRTIAIIDSDKALCAEAAKNFPRAKVFNADITDNSFIEEEQIDKYNLVICATHNHELNLVVSAYLESLGVEKTIALVAQSQYGNIARKLGIDVTIPIRDTLVDSIVSHLYGKSVTGIHTISDGSLEIVECDLPMNCEFAGRQLKDIAAPGEFLILLIKKQNGKYEIPQGNTVLSPNDHLVLIERTGDKKILEKFTGKK